ncbi:Putative uncharacterized protein [Taphrina deformans PYCC 5710]|uniref:ERCC4 domain-containing protein n=1 Tax=Taphrina deformans (strain PYCC 5710 / ATCC 11124 / CBS 356.35 / IMI 108563 / JCM 9778 / NBRC 8474) TaxID=1097556 RepID=R4XBD5_TAPDE|nr:Putative uncharacterized protein [Taphrina deformans PYCC 5710]|eukprot:CCG83164.1 Putative uncharacterized protein [Taphrina deformans PYCC 5710]
MEVIDIEDSPGKSTQIGHSPVRATCIISLSDSDESTHLPDIPLRRAFSVQDSQRPGSQQATDTQSQFPSDVDVIELTSSPTAKQQASMQEYLGSPRGLAGIKSSSDEELPDLLTRLHRPNIAPSKPAKISKSETLPTTFSTASASAIVRPIAPLSSRILDNIDTLMQERASEATLVVSQAAARNSLSKKCSTDSDTEEDSIAITSTKTAKRKLDKQSNAISLKEQKKLEREKLKLEKAQEKEQRLNEKRKAQSIAAVNTLKKTKKDSAPEMIVEMCSSVERSAFSTHFEQFMQSLGCTWSMVPMPIEGLMRIRRKLIAEYNPEKGYWIPLVTPEVVEEDQLIVFMKSAQFLRIAASAASLEEHVRSVKRQRPSAKILYLIEGLAALVKKSQAQKNRAYQAAVRAAGISSDEVSRPRKARMTDSTSNVDEILIEDALLDLQVIHNCLIVHSTSPADSAEHLSILISDLSTVPYKLERTGTLDIFCTESGQIKTGTDVRDTFEKMLQAIARVTPQIAQAVATKYCSIRELCAALHRGPQILELIPKGHNVDGTVTGQVLGTATSLRIYKALMSQDAHMDA